MESCGLPSSVGRRIPEPASKRARPNASSDVPASTLAAGPPSAVFAARGASFTQTGAALPACSHVGDPQLVRRSRIDRELMNEVHRVREERTGNNEGAANGRDRGARPRDVATVGEGRGREPVYGALADARGRQLGRGRRSAQPPRARSRPPRARRRERGRHRCSRLRHCSRGSPRRDHRRASATHRRRRLVPLDSRDASSPIASSSAPEGEAMNAPESARPGDYIQTWEEVARYEVVISVKHMDLAVGPKHGTGRSRG